MIFSVILGITFCQLQSIKNTYNGFFIWPNDSDTDGITIKKKDNYIERVAKHNTHMLFIISPKYPYIF